MKSSLLDVQNSGMFDANCIYFLTNHCSPSINSDSENTLKRKFRDHRIQGERSNIRCSGPLWNFVQHFQCRSYISALTVETCLSVIYRTISALSKPPDTIFEKRQGTSRHNMIGLWYRWVWCSDYWSDYVSLIRIGAIELFKIFLIMSSECCEVIFGFCRLWFGFVFGNFQG